MIVSNTMRSLFAIFSIIDVLGTDCHEALDFPLDDYEDALLVVCSNRIGADYIITRDEEFLNKAKPPVSVISPADFINSDKVKKLWLQSSGVRPMPFATSRPAHSFTYIWQ